MKMNNKYIKRGLPSCQGKYVQIPVFRTHAGLWLNFLHIYGYINHPHHKADAEYRKNQWSSNYILLKIHWMMRYAFFPVKECQPVDTSSFFAYCMWMGPYTAHKAPYIFSAILSLPPIIVNPLDTINITYTFFALEIAPHISLSRNRSMLEPDKVMGSGSARAVRQ